MFEGTQVHSLDHALLQVVMPLRHSSVGPLGCSWGVHPQTHPLVNLCAVLVSNAYPTMINSL